MNDNKKNLKAFVRQVVYDATRPIRKIWENIDTVVDWGPVNDALKKKFKPTPKAKTRP